MPKQLTVIVKKTIKETEKSRTLELARTMKSKGLFIEQIVEITGLSKSVVGKM